MKMMTPSVAAAALFGLMLVGAPHDASAQGRGRGQGPRDRVEHPDRGSLDDIFGRDSDRSVRRGNGSGKVPPGWCKGVGNPHNTPENCGWGSDRWYRDRENGSFADAHDRFHRALDERYRRLAANRPLDLAYQLELQVRKRAEHDRWHDRNDR